MARTVDVSGWPALAFHYVLTGSYVLVGVLLVALFGAGLLKGLGVSPGLPPGVAVASGAVVWAVATVLFGRRAHDADINWRKPVSFADGRESENLLAFYHWRRAIELLGGPATEDEDQDEPRRREDGSRSKGEDGERVAKRPTSGDGGSSRPGVAARSVTGDESEAVPGRQSPALPRSAREGGG